MQQNAENDKAFIDKIKVKLSSIQELRRDDDRFRSLQNEPYIDVWCDRVSTDEKDYGSPSLKCVVLDFLKNDEGQARTLNVFGESGSGKSTAMLKIEETLWDILDVENIGVVPQFFPLFMILKTVTYPMYQNMSLREAAMHSLGNILTLNDLAELEQLKSRLKLSPIWLLDGFDEMGRLQPICTDLYECGISIVTCRQQFLDSVLGGDFEKFLTPKDLHKNKQGQYEHVRLLPFSESQIEEYFCKWVELSSKRGDSGRHYETYQLTNVMYAFPSLWELSRNPYLLSLLCTLMPTFEEKYPGIKDILKLPSNVFSTNQGKRFGTSDVFKALVDALITKGVSRFVEQNDWTQKDRDEFPSACQHFCENVAFQMYEAKEKTYTFDMSSDDTKDRDQQFPLKFILQSIPFRKVGTSPLYAFPHKSLWEYFLACRSMRLPVETLGYELFTQDRDLLLAHAELLAQHEKLAEEFIKIVLTSRQKCSDHAEDKKQVTAACNALSILNFAAADNLIPFQFEDVRDWKGIRVPGVNLNHAKIMRCEFDGADLSNASLIRTLVVSSSFKNVDLRGASCGIKSILKGHIGSVNSLAIYKAPDGALLASGSEDKSVRVWDFETGECNFISPHAERVWDCPVSPIVAFTSRNSNCIFLWDTKTRKFCGILEGHSQKVECFCFSADGKTGASGSEDGTVRVWNIEEEKCVQILRANSPVSWVSYSPDGEKVASASTYFSQLWDLRTGVCTNKIKKDIVASILYHPNGKLIALFGKYSRTVDVLDAITTKKKFSIDSEGDISKISFLPDGSLIILSKSLKVWNIESNTCQRTLEERTGLNSTFALSRDLKVIVTVTTSDGNGSDVGRENIGSFNIWDMKTFECISSFGRGPNIPNNVCVSHDNSFIVATYSTCAAFSLWDIKTGEETRVNLGHFDNVQSVAFRPGSSNAVLASSSQIGFRLWERDDESWKCFYRIQGLVGLSKMTFSPDGSMVVGSHKGKFVMFDYEKKKIIRILSGDDRPLFPVYSPDGHFFVCLSDDRCGVDVFESATKRRVREIDTGNCCSYVCFNLDGKNLACVTYEGITLINWETGKPFINIKTNAGLIDFHPTNNHMIASTDFDKIRLWDAFTGKCLNTFIGHIGRISSLCFSPDGSTLASGGANGSILLWDLNTNHCLPSIGSKKSPELESICLSPDGRTLVAAGEGLYMYDVETRKLKSTLLSSACNVNHVSFNSDGSLLMYSLDDDVVELWDTKKNKSVRRFEGTMPCFSPDNTKILYINDAISVRNVAKGKRILNINFVDESALSDACFSPDGSMIIASFEDVKMIYFWNSTTGKKIKTVKAFWEGCKIRMSPNGNIMTFAECDILEIWNLAKSKSLTSFHGCEKATFSADGSKLAFNRNKSVILYDMQTIRLITTFEGHSSNIKCIYYHPDGRFLASCCEDMIFIWDLLTMQPHSVFGVNKTLQLDCDLQGAKIDASFSKILSDLSVHLFSTQTGMVNPSFIPFDKEQMHSYFENDEKKIE